MDRNERTRRLQFARAMAKALEAALAAGGSDVVSITVDGLSTRYDRRQALTELEHWRKQVDRYGRRTSRLRQIDLS